MVKKLCALALMAGLVTLTPAVSLAASPAPPAQAEHHPHIRAAIRELRGARKELQTAAHDFGGHRVDAIQAVDNAIKQLQIAVQYDKK